MSIKNIINRLELSFIKILIATHFIYSDELFLKIRWLIRMKYKLNLQNPQTFCEKIQWLKLYDRRPEYTQMVDKFAVKEYVSQMIGKEYIIPTIAVWNHPKDIDWDSLPNSFVLKTTHGGGGGGVVICKNKLELNEKKIKNRLYKSYKSCIYKTHREWPYKNVPKRIIAEVLMEESNNRELSDYKFFCFNGIPKFCQVIRNRKTKETIDFYDMQWNHMPFVGLNPNVENGNEPVQKPLKLNKMIEICNKLGKGIPFARIDLYVINENIYFGEITLYPATGMGRFKPKEWDIKLGKCLILPKSN